MTYREPDPNARLDALEPRVEALEKRAAKEGSLFRRFVLKLPEWIAAPLAVTLIGGFVAGSIFFVHSCEKAEVAETKLLDALTCRAMRAGFVRRLDGVGNDDVILCEKGGNLIVVEIRDGRVRVRGGR